MSINPRSDQEELVKHPPIYPYLLTRIATTLYHISVLPKENKNFLLDVAITQERYNDLATCLVLDTDTAIYLKKGKVTEGICAPSGGIIIANQFALCFDLNEYVKKDPSYKLREKALQDFINTQHASMW